MFDKFKRHAQHENPEQAHEYRKQADELLKNHQYIEALSTIEKAFLLAPDDSRNYELKLRYLQAMRNYGDAIDALDEAIRLDPQCAAYYVNKGMMLAFEELYEEALDAFDQGLRLDQSHSTQNAAHFNRARALYRLNRYEEALSALERIPTTTEHLQMHQSMIALTRGECLIGLARYQEALSALREALQFEPANADIWLHKGTTLVFIILEHNQSAQGIPESLVEEAFEAFDTALLLDPGSDLALEGKQMIQSTLLKQEGKAQQVFSPQQHIEDYPEAASVLKGNELFYDGKHEEAVALCEHALKTAKNPLVRSAIYANMSNSLFSLQRYPEALHAAEQALKLNPGDAVAYLSKGLALQRLGKYKASLAAFDESLRLDPTDAMTHCERAKDLFELQRYQEALASSQQALRLLPDFAAALYESGRALSTMNRYEEAFEKLQQVIKLNPNHGMAYIYAAKSLEMIERYEEALPLLDKALQTHSNQKVLQLAQDQRARMLTQFIPKPQRARTIARPPLSASFAAFRLVREGEALLLKESPHADSPDEALACFDKALQLDPYCDGAYTFKGITLSLRQRKTEALAIFEQVLLEGTSAWALSNASLNKGQCLFQRQRYHEALACFEDSLHLDPHSPPAYEYKIKVLTQLGRSDEARQAMLQARRLGFSGF